MERNDRLKSNATRLLAGLMANPKVTKICRGVTTEDFLREAEALESLVNVSVHLASMIEDKVDGVA